MTDNVGPKESRFEAKTPEAERSADDFERPSKQPSTKVEGFATIAETTSHQACLRPAPESPVGNPDPADFDLH